MSIEENKRLVRRDYGEVVSGGRVGQIERFVSPDYVEDVDAHYRRATAAGAEIVRELQDTEYKSREYTARDPEGNLWSFGTYQPFAAQS